MNQESNSPLSLAKREAPGRYIVLLIAVQVVVLAFLYFFLPSAELRLANLLCGVAILAVSYYCAFSQISERVLSYVISFGLILSASLVVSSGISTTLSVCAHYGQVVALGVIASYRDRRLMVLATLFSVLEQVCRKMFLPDSLFGAHSQEELIVTHICWLAASGVVFLLLCPCVSAGVATAAALANVAQDPATAAEVSTNSQTNLAKLAATKSSAALPATATGSTGSTGAASMSASTVQPAQTIRPSKPTAPAAAPEPVAAVVRTGPATMADVILAASEVGGRTKKLSRSITNLEGPLKRMVQSINGANRGMQEIKDELSRTTASVIQITQNSEMHANKANEVFQAADEAAYGSQIGAMSTEQSIINMDRIREQMDSIEQRMDNLLTKSQKMVAVVGFADELALQSKVLSVNAAIEAAKAGDRGQGFSAVATEVKSLANQSKEATREVRQILKEIQKSISEVRRSIALGNETVTLAADQCRSTAESIRGLDSSVSSSRDAAETIMNSSKDQVQGIMQISHAMNDIQTVSEQNSGSLSNLQVEAQKLNTIARELVSDMNSYQTMVDQLLSTCASLDEQETKK